MIKTAQTRPETLPLAGNFAFVEGAVKLSSHYAVMFVYEHEIFGSGTLVSVGGVHGILTAHHVSLVPERKGWQESSLCYRNDMLHNKIVKRSDYEHIIVGKYHESHADTGPDLSFLMFTNAALFSTLNAKKSFYPLDPKFNPGLSQYPMADLRKMPWWISGSPAEFTEPLGTDEDGDPKTKFSDFHADCGFELLEARDDGFDYITFDVHAGINKFPGDYGGMSGGGIWTVRVEEMPNGSRHPAQILQGVSFYQTTPESGHSKLIGHGPQSIYQKVLQTLKA